MMIILSSLPSLHTLQLRLTVLIPQLHSWLSSLYVSGSTNYQLTDL